MLQGLEAGEYPLRLEFYGRKKHTRLYYTFLGRDAIENLKVWKEKWTELHGAAPRPEDWVFLGKQDGHLNAAWLNSRFRSTASSLKKQGLVSNAEPRSWHVHALRHSFRTEASHAEVKSEVCEFFMGHLGGINYVYNHRDEPHPEDMVREYLKIEPFVSLSYNEAAARQEYEDREKLLITRMLNLERLAGP